MDDDLDVGVRDGELFAQRPVLVPSELLAVARTSGEVVVEISACELIRADGDPLAHRPQDAGHDVRRIISLLVAGPRQRQVDGGETPRGT